MQGWICAPTLPLGIQCARGVHNRSKAERLFVTYDRMSLSVLLVWLLFCHSGISVLLHRSAMRVWWCSHDGRCSCIPLPSVNRASLAPRLRYRRCVRGVAVKCCICLHPRAQHFTHVVVCPGIRKPETRQKRRLEIVGASHPGAMALGAGAIVCCVLQANWFISGVAYTAPADHSLRCDYKLRRLPVALIPAFETPPPPADFLPPLSSDLLLFPD